MSGAKVSVIVTTKNEEKNIERFLISVKNQTYSNTEIVVVDNFSSDSTLEISKKYTEKAFSYGPERSAQRNFAVENSNGKYVLILDADMELTPTVVKECVFEMEADSELKAITIPEKSVGENFWAQCKAFERSFYALEPDDPSDAARFFPREVFKEVGGYDSNITGPEDWDLPERIYKLYPKKKKIKALIIHHEGVVNLYKLLKKKNYYGRKAHVYLDKSKIGNINAKTIYFLRPVFYKYWKRWFENPMLSLGTLTMLTLELFAGGMGYLQGKYFDKA